MLRAAVLVFLPACGSGAEQTPSAPRTEIDADRDGVPAPEDCADGDADIHPGAEERCNGLDDDCDGDIDEDAVDSTAWYPDLDRDGYGADEGAVMACRPPEAGIARGGDCDDTTSTVNPARVETCNGRDDDCDGEIDEVGAVGETTWHADGDGDGFGTPATAVEACTAPAGHVRDATDCDDNRPDAHPGADEVCG
ncbi:MAG: putative metal-binding motif-containing protein, partial [Myxococcota bacterium]|nr:putative metal-binding motif-containing protein [Myxococcota bacterium]